MLPRLRHAGCLLFVTLTACAVKLTDRFDAATNGDVTGVPANCAAATGIEPGGAPGGEAAPKLVGRFSQVDEAGKPLASARFDWSGTYISARFQGTDRITVKLLLQGQPTANPNVPLLQDLLFEFVLDGVATTRQITVTADAAGKPTLTAQESYDIAVDPNVPHELVVHRNTEAQKGIITFNGFDLHGGAYLQPVRRPRRIEFIGDSITCGYGLLGGNATCPFEIPVRTLTDPTTGEPVIDPVTNRPVTVDVPVTESQYLAYTSQTARNLDADAVTICWSGKGVWKNLRDAYTPDANGVQAVDEKIADNATIPELWGAGSQRLPDVPGRTLATDDAGPAWDFAKEKPEEVPQVVVVNLGTNDFSRDARANDGTVGPSGHAEPDNIPDGDLDRVDQLEDFFQTYLRFVQKIRLRRPNAHIFLATPPMVSDQYPLLNARAHLKAILLRIVEEMQKVGDAKVYKLDLVEQGTRYGLACDYHPNQEVHRLMAEQLTGAIKTKTCW